MKLFFEGTNTLIILDDCAASKDVKGSTGELVNLAYSVRPIGISVCVVTQKYTAITTDFRQNAAALVLFYTPEAKTMKAVFDDWAGELSHDEYKDLVSKLKERNFSYLVFSSRRPFGVKLFIPHGSGRWSVDRSYEFAGSRALSGRAASGPDIPALHEQLAVLGSTDKAKEAIGVHLTHDQVKRLSDKDVEKYGRRYETYVGTKTTETLIDGAIFVTVLGINNSSQYISCCNCNKKTSLHETKS